MAEFELSPELRDQIVYAMENQSNLFFLDTETLDIISGTCNDESRFIILPPWKSSDGFILMEKFVTSIRNPLYREELRSILTGGRGVFKNFKLTLKKHTELERLWFHFKDKEMKLRILEWYNSWREVWGLEKIGLEPEETDQLILSDFSVESGSGGFDQLILAMDKKALYENFEEYPGNLSDYFINHLRTDEDYTVPVPHTLFHTLTPGGELSAFIWSRQVVSHPREGDSLKRQSLAYDIIQMYVLPEYRGLGLASYLLEHFADFAYRQEADWLFLNVNKRNSGFSKSLVSRGFVQTDALFELNVRVWGQETEL